MEWLSIKENGKADDGMVEAVEAEFGIKFPKDFMECSKKNGSGYPKENTLDIVDIKGLVFNRLLSFNPDNKYNYILRRQKIEGLQKGLISIADDGFGNFYCYDYRYDKNNPSIVYWEHETQGIYKAYDTFSELLNNLYEDEEED